MQQQDQGLYCLRRPEIHQQMALTCFTYANPLQRSTTHETSHFATDRLLLLSFAWLFVVGADGGGVFVNVTFVYLFVCFTAIH